MLRPGVSLGEHFLGDMHRRFVIEVQDGHSGFVESQHSLVSPFLKIGSGIVWIVQVVDLQPYPDRSSSPLFPMHYTQ